MKTSTRLAAWVGLLGTLALAPPRASAQDTTTRMDDTDVAAVTPAPAPAEPPASTDPPPAAVAAAPPVDATRPPAVDTVPRPPPAPPKSEVALELAMHAGSITGGTVFGFSPLLRASIQVHAHVAVEAVWAFPFASVSPDAGSASSALRISNPWLAGYYTGAFGKLKLRLGVGVGLPLASMPTVDPMDPSSVQHAAAARLAFAEGGGVRGVWVPWLWAVDYLSIGVPLTATVGVAENVNVVGDVGFAYLVYTGDDATRENRTFMRFGAAASYTAGIVQAGLRFQAIWFPSDDGDNAQLAIEPFARFNFGVPFLRVGFLMNLDEPRGFAFGENHVWGLRIEGGASF